MQVPCGYLDQCQVYAGTLLVPWPVWGKYRSWPTEYVTRVLPGGIITVLSAFTRTRHREGSSMAGPPWWWESIEGETPDGLQERIPEPMTTLIAGKSWGQDRWYSYTTAACPTTTVAARHSSLLSDVVSSHLVLPSFLPDWCGEKCDYRVRAQDTKSKQDTLPNRQWDIPHDRVNWDRQKTRP